VSTLILSIIVRVIKNGELKLSLVDAYLSKKKGRGCVTPEPAKVSTPESSLAAPGLNAHHDQIVFITPTVFPIQSRGMCPLLSHLHPYPQFQLA